MRNILNAKLLIRCGVMIIALVLFYGCNVTGEDEKNTLPVANLGTDQTVGINNQVQLSGSESSDGDSDTLTYLWSITSAPIGSVATLSSTTIINPTFTPVVAGDYTIQLIVNDGIANSAPAKITITANEFIGDFSRSFVESGETHGLVAVGTNMKETYQVFIGDGSAFDYDMDGTADFTYELNTIYIISATYSVIDSVDTLLWKLIIKTVEPIDLSDASLLVVNFGGNWSTSGGAYDSISSSVAGVTNQISADGDTLIQTSAGGATVNSFTRL